MNRRQKRAPTKQEIYTTIENNTRMLTTQNYRISQKMDSMSELVSFLKQASIGIQTQKAEKGSNVFISYVGRVDGKPFAGGMSEGFSLSNLGGGSLIPGFEEQLFGMNVGEKRTINVTFPEQYNSEELAGKNAEFEVLLIHAFENNKAYLEGLEMVNQAKKEMGENNGTKQ